jgi:spermidine synthase
MSLLLSPSANNLLPGYPSRFTSGRCTIRIPFHQKLLSYFGPVSLRQSPSDLSGVLELVLYHNRFQLLTDGACYSDGDRYRPAVALALHLKDFLPKSKRVLVLGAGLGSMVHVLRARGLDPRFTLVERDITVLRWLREILGDDARKVDLVCRDAESFMAQNQRKVDLVFVDVFQGNVVPDFVTARPFLKQCWDSLSPGGHVALNYLKVDESQWEKARGLVAAVIPDCHVISKDDSRILVSPARGCSG